MLTPVEVEMEALSWIWVALPSVAAQIPPPPALTEEQLKENPPKPAPNVLDPAAMFAETMKRAAQARHFHALTSELRDMLLPAIHRASFPNADIDDSRAAVAKLVQQEPDLQSSTKDVSLTTFADILYRRVLHPHWLPAIDLLSMVADGENLPAAPAPAHVGGSSMSLHRTDTATSSMMGGARGSMHRTASILTTTPRGLSVSSATPAPATALVKMFRDLAHVILDAPVMTTEPVLLPLERVMALPSSGAAAGAAPAQPGMPAATPAGPGYALKHIPVELTTFVPLDQQLEHPKVFDDMWEALVAFEALPNTSGSCTKPENSCISVETFQQWLGLFLSFTVENFMEERSKVAGKHHFDEIYGVEMTFGSCEFRTAARRLFVLYTRRLVPHGYSTACVPHFERMMQAAAARTADPKRILTVRLVASTDSGLPADVIERCKFTTTDALYAPDNLNPQETLDDEVFPQKTVNRVLVAGKEGLVSHDFCRKLAESLNVPHIDTLQLLVAAYDNKDGSHATAAAEIRACIEEERPIPIALQATLVGDALRQDSTQFRGYVFGDLPPALEGDAAWIESFLQHSGLADHGATPPRIVLEMGCLGELYGQLRAQYRDAVAAKYSEELAVRDKEADEVAARQAKVQRKEAARAFLAEREEQRGRIARGESPQPPDDQLEAEQQKEAANQAIAEEEDEVDPDTIDPETGGLVDPELVPAVKQAKAAVRKRRSDLAEIHRLYHASRTADFSAPLAASQVMACPALAAVAECAAANGGRYLRSVPCHDDSPNDLLRYVTKRLNLQPTVTPKQQLMSAEMAAGYESSPDNDTSVGETFREELLATYRRGAYGDFCPVTKYEEDGLLVKGSWFFSCGYREYAYCFASGEKLRKFLDNPTRYLLQDPSSRSPMLLCQDIFGAVEQAGFTAQEIHETLAARLKLSARDLSRFHANWKQFDAEVARRAQITESRRAAVLAEKKDREARLKVAVSEAEGLSKGKGRAAAKGPAAGAAAGGGATATAPKPGLNSKAAGRKSAAAAVAAAVKTEVEGPTTSASDIAELERRKSRAMSELVEKPQTTASRIAARITAEQARRAHAIRPLLVSALTAWDADELRAARARKVLPECIVSFHYTPPPKLDADGNPVAAGDTAALEDDENDANGGAGAGGDDDQGGSATNTATNPDDPKQSRRFWAKFLAELEEESQNAQAADDGLSGGVALNPDGPQNFKIVRINLYDFAKAGLSTLVDMVLYTVREVGFRCDPPAAGGGDLTLEDDEPELDEHEEALVAAGHPAPDPLLRAGPKAVHQFGDTATFCPVALVRDGMLVQGDPSLWMQLNGRKFMFVSQASMDAFKQLPSRFIPVAPPQPAPLPPPRIWLLGATASGKTDLANQLCREFGLVRFSTQPERLLSYLAAATTPGGAEVQLVSGSADVANNTSRIPECNPEHNEFLREAVALKKALDDFAKDQADKAKARKQAEHDQQEREQWIEDGEEVPDLTEVQHAAQQAALEWEPEDEELRTERLALAHRRLAAVLSRIEPWASRGYLLEGEPANDAELNGMLDAKLIPEVVVRLTLGVESFLERRFQPELAAREADYASRVREFRLKQSAMQLFARVSEITKWRRRNVGADDAAIEPPPELENVEDEPEPVDVESVRGDMERLFEGSTAEVDALVEVLPERRIPVVTLRGDDGREALLASAKTALARNLLHRASLLEHPQVLSMDEAISRIKAGRALLSSFYYEDPVLVYERRHEGKYPALKWTAVESVAVPEEPAWQEPDPAALDAEREDGKNKEDETKTPKKQREKKYKTVQDDDGNDVEVTDEDAEYSDEEQEDDAGNNNENNNNNNEPEEGEPQEEAEPEEDPFLQLEENPELAPEEMDEMQQELDAERKRRADRQGRRACILRNRVYFFDDDTTLRRFLTENPRRFCEQPPLLPRTSGSIVAVQALDNVLIGDAKQNTIESISGNCNAVYLSLPKLVEWGCCSKQAEMFPALRRQALVIALHRDPTTLEALSSCAGTPTPEALEAAGGVGDASEEESTNNNNNTHFTDEWIETALACRLQCSDVQERGAVLCNLPRTPAQLQRLISEGIDVHNMLVFPGTSPALLDGIARGELSKTIRCVHAMKAPLGTSQALHEAANVINATNDARRRVLLARQLGFPLVVDAAALKEEQILSGRCRSPHYGYYCPWTWAREDRLLERDPDLDVKNDPSCAARRNLVEFLGQLFFFSDSATRIQEFLSFPERFIGAKFQPKRLPKLLPRRIGEPSSASSSSSNSSSHNSNAATAALSGDAATAAATAAGIELCGFCPVALCDTRLRRGLCGLVEPRAVLGDARYTAEYDGKRYRMQSEEALQHFLSEPWTYVAGAVLPAADRFPQSRDDLQSASLELFLRRALRESVARAMSEVESVRPKFPNLSVQQSALRFIALYMRAHHPEPQSEFAARVHQENFAQFVELATMARNGGLVPPKEGASAAEQEAFEKRCKMWDLLLDDPQAFYERFSGLRMEPKDKKRIGME